MLVQTTGGERLVVAIDWTDINTNKVGEPQSPTHLLDYQGLLQALELIECIRQRGSATTCRTEEADYDENSQAKSRDLRRSSHDPSSPKRRVGEPEPGVGTVEPRASSRGDPFDGTVSAQADRGADRKQPEGGL